MEYGKKHENKLRLKWERIEKDGTEEKGNKRRKFRKTNNGREGSEGVV